MANINFLEDVFSSKSNKHGFNTFDKKYLNKLQFKQKNKSIQLVCLIRKKLIKNVNKNFLFFSMKIKKQIEKINKIKGNLFPDKTIPNKTINTNKKLIIINFF